MNTKLAFKAALAVVRAVLCACSVAYANLESQFGVAEAMPDGRWCLSIANQSLAPHDSVEIILDGSPQVHLEAEITAKQEDACLRKPPIPGDRVLHFATKNRAC